MASTLEAFLHWLEQVPPWVLFGAMFLGGFLEYIFPPVPGDVWTAGGAVLIARGQSFWIVFLGVNLGALAGFLIDYGFGAWLAHPRRRFRHWGPRWEEMGRGIDRIAAGFQRHTALFLTVNRFLPGVRALFFVAAGFARVRLGSVVVFGLLSSLAWTLWLIAAGYLAGRNLHLVEVWLARYTWSAWVVLTVAVLGAAAWARTSRRKRRRRSESQEARPGSGEPA
jgi:membrane protein DedA with SNARE-associated domain